MSIFGSGRNKNNETEHFTEEPMEQSEIASADDSFEQYRPAVDREDFAVPESSNDHNQEHGQERVEYTEQDLEQEIEEAAAQMLSEEDQLSGLIDQEYAAQFQRIREEYDEEAGERIVGEAKAALLEKLRGKESKNKFTGFIKKQASKFGLGALAGIGVRSVVKNSARVYLGAQSLGASVALGGVLGGGFAAIQTYRKEREKIESSEILRQLDEALLEKDNVKTAHIIDEARKELKSGKLFPLEANALKVQLQKAELGLRLRLNPEWQEQSPAIQFLTALNESRQSRQELRKLDEIKNQTLEEKIKFEMVKNPEFKKKMVTNILVGAAAGGLGGAAGHGIHALLETEYAQEVISKVVGNFVDTEPVVQRAIERGGDKLAENIDMINHEIANAHAAEVIDKSQAELLEKTFSTKAYKGEGATHAARMLLHDYLVNKAEISGSSQTELTEEQLAKLIYAEDSLMKEYFLEQTAGPDHIVQPDQGFELTGQQIEDAWTKAEGLSPEELENISKMLDTPGHRLSEETLERLRSEGLMESSNNFFDKNTEFTTDGFAGNGGEQQVDSLTVQAEADSIAYQEQLDGNMGGTASQVENTPIDKPDKKLSSVFDSVTPYGNVVAVGVAAGVVGFLALRARNEAKRINDLQDNLEGPQEDEASFTVDGQEEIRDERDEREEQWDEFLNNNNVNPVVEEQVSDKNEFPVPPKTPPTPWTLPEVTPVVESPAVESSAEQAPEPKNKAESISGFGYSAESMKKEKEGAVNEDRFIIDQENGFLAVFDGVGGHGGGDVASSTAREVFASKVQEMNEAKTEEEIVKILESTVEEAHQAIKQNAYEKGLDRDAATTGVIGKILKGENGEQKLIFVSIGDSRIYIRDKDNTVHPITFDMEEKSRDLEKQLREVSSEKDFEGNDLLRVMYERRNYISNAMGGRGVPSVEVSSTILEPGDVVFATSDGVHDNLTDSEIEASLKGVNSAEEFSKILVEAARKRADTAALGEVEKHIRAKDDDITAVAFSVDNYEPNVSEGVIELGDVDEPAEEKPLEEKSPEAQPVSQQEIDWSSALSGEQEPESEADDLEKFEGLESREINEQAKEKGLTPGQRSVWFELMRSDGGILNSAVGKDKPLTNKDVKAIQDALVSVDNYTNEGNKKVETAKAVKLVPIYQEILFPLYTKLEKGSTQWNYIDKIIRHITKLTSKKTMDVVTEAENIALNKLNLTRKKLGLARAK